MNREQMQSWRVVYVSSRQEKAVAMRLEQQSIEAYVPLLRKLQRWSDRRKWVEFPLFHGYVMVKPDARQFDKVLQTPGVVAYVRFNGQAAVVREEEIKIIRQLVTFGYDLESVGIEPGTPEGTAVRVVQGPLKGCTGIVVQCEKGTDFQISLEGFRQGIRVRLPSGYLERITL
jgi:transcriptional antiterminator NusG